MNENIEEIIIEDDAEFELLEKRFLKCSNVPLICIGSGCIYFNKLAGKLIPKYIKWFSSGEYIIALPTAENDPNGFVTRKTTYDSKGYFQQATFPASMRNAKKVKKGYYKVYKYKNGIAFKRYEPITDFSEI